MFPIWLQIESINWRLLKGKKSSDITKSHTDTPQITQIIDSRKVKLRLKIKLIKQVPETLSSLLSKPMLS